MIYSIDIETENEGIDVLNGVQRVISVQIGDDVRQELYYPDSKNPQFTLESFGSRLHELLDEGHLFSGYNIKGFDLPILKKFHDVLIPDSQTIDIMENRAIEDLRTRLGWKRLPLEKACESFGVNAGHKNLMQRESEKYRTNELVSEARVYAVQLIREKGWSDSFALDYVMKNLATKQAITESYREFVRLSGQQNTLFYKYAVGDIICESQLLKVITSKEEARS